MSEVLPRVRSYLLQVTRLPDIENDRDIFASGLLNSLFAMQLIMYLEQEFELKINDEDLDITNFSSVDAISSFVLRKKNTDESAGVEP